MPCVIKENGQQLRVSRTEGSPPLRELFLSNTAPLAHDIFLYKEFFMKLRNVLVLAVITALSLTGCAESDTGSKSLPDLPDALTISPTVGVTTGTELTADYNGTEDVTYQWNKGGTAIFGASDAKYTPTEAGSYTVTAKAEGYKSKTSAAVNVSAVPQTPTAADYDIGNQPQKVDRITGVTITPKTGKSGGKVTIYYNDLTALPTAVGEYEVTFDVAAAEGWNEAKGLPAGTFSIYYGVFNTITAFKTWLDAQPVNTVAVPYAVALNVANLGGAYKTSGSVGAALYDNLDKYIDLDLSSSTFTSIVDSAFDGCSNLASVNIPDGVTSIEGYAFAACRSLASVTIGSGVTSIGILAFSSLTSLASVTFEGTIASSGFIDNAFPSIGNLRAKFYETDKKNGTPGTYTRTVPGDRNSEWTKQ
jgi:type IV pilus biogenesis protein CpaD/CtpE